jgi:hypothetical protein
MRVESAAASALPKNTTSIPRWRSIRVAARATPARLVPFSTSTVIRFSNEGIG